MSEPKSRGYRWSVRGIVVGYAVIAVGLVAAWVSPSADCRAGFTLSLLGVCMAIVSCAVASSSKRSFLIPIVPMLMLIVFLGLALVGSWDYWAARRMVWEGDYSGALSSLDLAVAAYDAPGVTVPLPPGVTIRVGAKGIMLASEAELWFGIARASEYSGDYETSLRAYQTTLEESEGIWTDARREEIARMMREVEATRLP